MEKRHGRKKIASFSLSQCISLSYSAFSTFFCVFNYHTFFFLCLFSDSLLLHLSLFLVLSQSFSIFSFPSLSFFLFLFHTLLSYCFFLIFFLFFLFLYHWLFFLLTAVPIFSTHFLVPSLFSLSCACSLSLSLSPLSCFLSLFLRCHLRSFVQSHFI